MSRAVNKVSIFGREFVFYQIRETEMDRIGEYARDLFAYAIMACFAMIFSGAVIAFAFVVPPQFMGVFLTVGLIALPFSAASWIATLESRRRIRRVLRTIREESTEPNT